MIDRIPYIFFYVRDLARARDFYEHVLHLKPVEEDDGSVKYDCGRVMLALNVISTAPRRDHGALTVFAVDNVEEQQRDLRSHDVATTALVDEVPRVACGFFDPDGHFLGLSERAHNERPASTGAPTILRVSLFVADLATANDYFGHRLGLSTLDRSAPEGGIRFGTAPLGLFVHQARIDLTRPAEPIAAYVFHTDDCEREAARLAGQGIVVGRVVTSTIGRTATFGDADGNAFYLYQPSLEALTWPSGPVYKRIVEEPRVVPA